MSLDPILVDSQIEFKVEEVLIVMSSGITYSITFSGKTRTVVTTGGRYITISTLPFS